MDDLAKLYPEYDDMGTTDVDHQYINLLNDRDKILKKKGYKYL